MLLLLLGCTPPESITERTPLGPPETAADGPDVGAPSRPAVAPLTKASEAPEGLSLVFYPHFTGLDGSGPPDPLVSGGELPFRLTDTAATAMLDVVPSGCVGRLEMYPVLRFPGDVHVTSYMLYDCGSNYSEESDTETFTLTLRVDDYIAEPESFLGGPVRFEMAVEDISREGEGALVYEVAFDLTAVEGR